ncbi:hypothetical protein BKG76_03730 [Mycobacteroides franklinii]|uniref:Uncharacterized protein n=1 Tax=Mycobacteroides franklinii TaxID=948102 RepID=A0A1S1L9W8_9MYCO|nr:hypothetical protein [Mycobacteroides franklinii]OHU30839.1 hypothetical protein BKG76_03730 [Mycobacteroides franklinii]
MAEDAATGLDANELYLDGDAAARVARHFEALAQKLQDMRQDFGEFGADLGMNECTEGLTWNDKVNEAASHVYHAMGGFSKRASDYQQKADATQAAFKNVEEQNRRRFQNGEMPNVTRDAGYPSPGAGTFEI